MKLKFIIFLMIFTLLSGAAKARTGKVLLKSGAAVSGKLLQSNGKPLPYTEIELVPTDSGKQVNDRRLLATTGAAGLFSFNDVPDGKYTLSINFDEKPSETSPYITFFYPNAVNRAEAGVFTITAASRFSALVFKLPPKLLQRKITGTVIGADGKPVAGVFINLKDIESDDLSLAFDNKTDKAGKFNLSGFETRTYFIAAILLDKLPTVGDATFNPLAVGKTNPFTLKADTANFTIKLEKVGEKKIMLDNDVGMLSAQHRTEKNPMIEH